MKDFSCNDILEIYWTDVYKTGHKFMLPPGSTLMVSNFTPRSGKRSNIPNSKGIISFGQQKLVRQMHSDWNRNFFKRDISEIEQFGKDMTDMLMLSEPFDIQHFKDLHDVGYLPIELRSIEEGTFIPYKVPMYSIVNTQPISNVVFDWIVNYLETILSAEAWMAPTSATTAFAFKKAGRKGILATDPENLWFLEYKYHDFSMRGMGGKSAIVNSGLGFAAVSCGSDTLPVIPLARIFYDEVKPCINSVIATEHAIMATLTGFFLQQEGGSWDKIGELEVKTFEYLLKQFPTGILSLVSDTWDIFRVLTEYCVTLKDEILARDGKLVIRPDSGDPIHIMTGYYLQEWLDNGGTIETFDTDPAAKGVIRLLWDVFGGSLTSTGYKKLNPSVGAIYGDAITLERSDAIDVRMTDMSFATTNYVLGVGSYSLQHVTRDTHGFAQKATHVIVNGQDIEIFKDPVTDTGSKKSARGLLVVFKDENGQYYLKDRATWEEVNSPENCLKVIYRDGEFFNSTTLTEIRGRINELLEVN